MYMSVEKQIKKLHLQNFKNFFEIVQAIYTENSLKE